MKKLTLVLYFLSLSIHAHARGDGDLWAPFVMNVCLAQDAAYLETTTVGKAFSAKPEYQQAVEGEMGKMFTCMANKNPMPDGLCKTLLNQTQESSESLNLDKLYDEHWQLIQKLREAQQACMPQ